MAVASRASGTDVLKTHHNMKILDAILFFAGSVVTGVLMTGCATSGAPDQTDIIAEWSGDFYTVQLRPAPDLSRSSDNLARYHVSRSKAGSKTLTIKSGHPTSDFRPKVQYDPKSVVRVIEGSDESFMIIEEAPSNDCWPYKNYILISSQRNGGMDFKYLWVPEVAHDGEGTPLDPSTILSLRGSELRFRYANGIEATRNLDDIRSTPEPPPHG